MTDEQLTEQDLADLAALNADDEKQVLLHTVLESWQAHLSSADAVAKERVHPGYANKIVSTWPKLSYQDVAAYHQRFHQRVIELRDVFDEILQNHLENKPDAFLHLEDDAEYNEAAYIETIYAWQARIQEWERAWDVRSKTAHIDVAVIADVSSFFVGQMGIVQFLDNIGFDFGPEKQQKVSDRLREHLASLG